MAYEPGWGHYEVKGVARFFRDRVYPTFGATGTAAGATSQVTEGWGVGAAAILPVVKNKVDIDLQGLIGRALAATAPPAVPT